MVKVFFLLFFAITSADVFAWGPATHLYFGLGILDRLSHLIPAMQMILGANPMTYLYGCVSADIVLAKKFGKAATHCHRWENGMKLLQVADTDRQQAFALGYLSHLAADTQSHNCYVPSKTVESATSRGILNHMVWELRFDKALVTPEIMKLFTILAHEQHDDCDALFQKVIETRILDFSFNKKIFNHIMVLQGVESWQLLLSKLNSNKEQPLLENTIEDYKKRAIDAMFDFLNQGMASSAVSYDPIGEERQKLASHVRTHVRKNLKTFDRDRLTALVLEFHKKPNLVIEIDSFLR